LQMCFSVLKRAMSIQEKIIFFSLKELFRETKMGTVNSMSYNVDISICCFTWTGNVYEKAGVLTRSCQSQRRRCRCCPETASGRRRNTSSPQSRACARLKGTVAYQDTELVGGPFLCIRSTCPISKASKGSN
jgi:hypothetical protein